MTDNALYDITERVVALENLFAARTAPSPYPGLVELRNWGPKYAVNTGTAGVGYNGTLNTDSLTLSPTGLQMYRVTSTDDFITVPRGPMIDNLTSFSFETFFLYNGYSEDVTQLPLDNALLFLKFPINLMYIPNVPGTTDAYWMINVYNSYFNGNGPIFLPGNWYDVQISWAAPLSSSVPNMYVNGTPVSLGFAWEGGVYDDSYFDLQFFCNMPGSPTATIYADVAIIRWSNIPLVTDQFAQNRAFDIALVTG